jgi:hypothetical protein
MSLSAKREALARIHGRYQRAGRPHKQRILDEFCATCGCHRKAALRLLNRPLPSGPPKRSGPKIIYDPAAVLLVLKLIWLASDQLCSKLLKAALPGWLAHHERRAAPLPEAFKETILGISPAQIDRLLRHAVRTRSGPPDTARPGSVEADTVAHCDDSTEGEYVNSLTFTELFSGWTENRAIWNKSGEGVLVQLKELEGVVPYVMKDFHTDNGGEFLNWALHRHLSGRAAPMSWTRSRAYRKNDNAHCEQKNWTHVRQLFGHERFAHPELVRSLRPGMEPVHQPLQADLQAGEAGEAGREDQTDLRAAAADTVSTTARQPGHPGSDEGQTAGATRGAGSLRLEEKH